MKRQPVNREEVFAAADQIVDDGLVPTQRAIIQRVGGSYATIGVFLEEWRRARRAASKNIKNTVPDQIRIVTLAYAQELWENAIALANDNLLSDRNALQREQGILDEDRIETLAVVRGMEEEVQRKEGQIASLQVALREAQNASDTLRRELAEIHERAAVAEARLCDAERRVSDQTRELSRTEQINTDLLKSLLARPHRRKPNNGRRAPAL